MCIRDRDYTDALENKRQIDVTFDHVKMEDGKTVIVINTEDQPFVNYYLDARANPVTLKLYDANGSLIKETTICLLYTSGNVWENDLPYYGHADDPYDLANAASLEERSFLPCTVPEGRTAPPGWRR